MAFAGLALRPVVTLVSLGLINRGLAPGLTNRVRWLNHRYVVRQSLPYFQNDFAGRIAQKVMQTGHAVREAVINVIDRVWFLLIYLVGTLALFAGIDWWLLLPVVVWRSEAHTSELQSLMRISYAVFCLKKKTQQL